MGAATQPKTFSGTFLVPGVSLNGRLYTEELIGKAVARMRARIADPDGLPISMRTSHGAGDNSRLIVARVTGAKQQPDGSATYDARWYDTAPARDIAELVQPADGGPPGLRTVSIHGYFLGETRKVEVGGVEALTSDDLEVTHIDFTGTPGVVKALINISGQRPAESVADAHGRTPIFETWEVPVGEDADSQPAVDSIPIAESGATTPDDEAYTAQQKRDALKAGQAMKNADGKPAYTIKNKADLRRAIRAVGRGGADHDAIRKHVIDRAKALGLSAMIPDNWNADGSLKEAATRFGEIRECYDCGPDGRAGFAIDAYNGPVSLTLRAPSLDPSGLRAIATAAMGAALDALGALDPDFDADIDVPGAPAADTDGDMGAGEAAPDDPAAATTDDDEDTPNPGDACPCNCGCAIPSAPTPAPGCPCTCGCLVCCAVAPESAPRPTSAAPAAEAVAFEGAPGPELAAPETAGYVTPTLAPQSAPIPQPPIEESAVSETATPAAEAATPTPAPTVAAPVIQLTTEQFRDLIAAVRPAATESAPTATTVEPTATEPAPVATDAAPSAPPAQEPVAQPSIEEAITAALTKALPVLRDSIVSQYGLPPRRGFRTAETDTNGGEMTPDQMWDNRADLLLGDLGKVG